MSGSGEKKKVKKFTPTPKQEEFMDAVFSGKYNVVTYGGAIRGGKTYAALGTAVMLSAKYPGSRWAVVRRTLQVLKDTTIKSFFDKICPMGFVEDYNKSEQTVKFTNGSEIVFFGENFENDKDLNRFKGLEVNGFILEEVNELQEETFDKAIERAGSHFIGEGESQPPPIIMCTCNPSKGWFKEKMYDPWKMGNLDDDWKYIPSRIFDNPYVPQEYLNSLKKMSPYRYEKFVNGNWDIEEQTGNEAYYAFNPNTHVKELTYDPHTPIWLSVDFNVVPHMTMTVWQIAVVDGVNELRCIKEYALPTPKNKTKFIGEAFYKDFKDNPPPYILYTGDPSGRKKDTRMEGGGNDYSILHNELLNFSPRDMVLRKFPRIVSRLSYINDILSNSIPSMRIYIDKSCSGFITDMINTKEEADGTKKKERKTDPKTGIKYETTCHFNDTLDYFVCTKFSKEYKRHTGKRRRLLGGL